MSKKKNNRYNHRKEYTRQLLSTFSIKHAKISMPISLMVLVIMASLKKL